MLAQYPEYVTQKLPLLSGEIGLDKSLAAHIKEMLIRGER